MAGEERRDAFVTGRGGWNLVFPRTGQLDVGKEQRKMKHFNQLQGLVNADVKISVTTES